MTELIHDREWAAALEMMEDEYSWAEAHPLQEYSGGQTNHRPAVTSWGQAQSVEADLDKIEQADDCRPQMDALRRILGNLEALADERAAPERAHLMQQRALGTLGSLADSGCVDHETADAVAQGVADAVEALQRGGYRGVSDIVDAVRQRLPEEPPSMMRRAGGRVRAFDDGAIRFTPPYSKDAADYRDPDDRDFDPGHDRCETCVHYIEGGGCHFVQGGIDPQAYCTEFYADYGAFAHDHGDYVEMNAELVSPTWDYTEAGIRDLVDAIEERMQQRAREQDATDRWGVNPDGSRRFEVDRPEDRWGTSNPGP